ncbi:hypothetical protein H4S06_002285 [Coemansia sp. BCRC 34490]|nr:hypothetical protein H4S06_002285 [Coemansia sp. BCRC 34490]
MRRASALRQGSANAGSIPLPHHSTPVHGDTTGRSSRSSGSDSAGATNSLIDRNGTPA